MKKSISFPMAWAVGAMMETVYGTFRIKSEPQMTRFLAAQLARSHYFDISRAREDFSYNAQVSTSAGMERLAAELNPHS